MASSSSKSNTSSYKWSYDVFVSFGSEDHIIKSFVDFLFADFKRKGIRAFREDEHVQRGEERSKQVYRAIEESRFLVLVFSASFTSSPSCLQELVKILKCKEENHDKYQIRTIFHNVNPETLLKQTESHVETFSQYDQFLESTDEVPHWREALTKAANLPGWDLDEMANGYESKFIDMISKQIFNELNDGPLHISEKLVGVHSRAEQLDLLSFVGLSDQVHMIGICGVAGIGKTAISKAIYNRLYSHFEVCIFCEDVKEFVEKYGMVQLQMQVIEDVTKTESKIRTVGEGSSVMKRIMATKRVLLVLDDVDEMEHLEALAGSPCWFGQGSLVVITGKDRQLLIAHGVERVYDVEVLHDDVAMEVFSLYAFNQTEPKDEFKPISEEMVPYMKGHPLALKVLGCFLFGKGLCEWESEFSRLQRYPNDDIQELISRFSLNKKRKPAE
uniref:disease resistance protein RUN1-like n=1 Tax=Erigeron canadensis TaxID=72917 RepID=UPI001CB8F325|nr:disease resistance protein RUN1-like [Erigeron canadensis]